MTAVDGKGTRAGLSRLASYLFATLEAAVVIAALAAVWQLAAVLIGSPYFPPIVAVLARMVEKWFSGPAYFLFVDPIFITDIIPSIGRAILAFAICGVLGVGIGLALGLSRWLSDFVDPIVHFARSLPAVTLLPLFLLLLGLDTKMKLSFIVFGAIWPVVLNTMHGVRAIDPLALETARVFLVPWRRRIFQVVLPAASPEIFAGLRVSLSLALILMVVSEMVAATGGLGFSIVQAQRTFAIRDMWAGVVVLGLAGYLLNGVFLAVENALLRWHRAASGRLVQ